VTGVLLARRGKDANRTDAPTTSVPAPARAAFASPPEPPPPLVELPQ